MSRLKILLTGASGSVGIQTFKELYKRRDQFEIKLLLRKSRKNKQLFKKYKKDVEIIWGDLLNRSEVDRAVNNIDIVIHLAAVIPLSKESAPYYSYAVNVEGTQYILDAMKKQSTNPKIIYSSSVAIYGDRRGNPWIKVADPVSPAYGDYYAQTKVEAEKRIKNSGLDYCILRLAYCASIKTLKFHPIMFRMPLDTDIEIIGTKDVGKTIINALEADYIWGKTFNLGGGKKGRIKYEDFLNNLFTIMGLGKGFIPKVAFSTIGYHCAYYTPEESRKLLNFQPFTLQDFYKKAKKWIGIKRFFTPLIRWFLRKYFLRRSIFYTLYKKRKKNIN